MLTDSSDDSTQTIFFAKQELILSGLGALIWPSQELMIVADLHLEKGSYYAKLGNPLPLYDTLDTLRRLENILHLFKPKRILSLGDNIHDIYALTRIKQEDQQLLKKITDSIDEWIWLVGNHDQHIVPTDLKKIRVCQQIELEQITFTHDHLPNIPWQILGHYHPKASYKKVSGKCFLVNPNKIILPSFGSYTGGLSFKSPIFQEIRGNDRFKTYLLNKNKIWRID